MDFNEISYILSITLCTDIYLLSGMMPALLGQWKVPKMDFTLGVMSPETPEAVIFLETVINLDQNRTHVIKITVPY